MTISRTAVSLRWDDEPFEYPPIKKQRPKALLQVNLSIFRPTHPLPRLSSLPDTPLKQRELLYRDIGVPPVF